METNPETQVIVYSFICMTTSWEFREERRDLGCAFCCFKPKHLHGLFCHLSSSHYRFVFTCKVSQTFTEIFCRIRRERDQQACLSDLYGDCDQFRPYFYHYSTRGKQEMIGEHYLTNESIERIAMHYRQFFHSQTGEALNPEDEKQLIDSDDEVDEDWIHTKSAELIDDFHDVSKTEKNFMKMWNSFVLTKKKIYSEHALPDVIFQFIQHHKKEFESTLSLKRQLVLHLIHLWDLGVVVPSVIPQSLQLLNTKHE